VNREKAWSAANWVFDHILRVSRKHLPTEGSARIVKLIENIVPGLNSLSLENLSPEEMKIFREALDAAYKEVLSTGKESFGEPEFYLGFMKRFEELIEMIPGDGS
jgi:hypothetical protein